MKYRALAGRSVLAGTIIPRLREGRGARVPMDELILAVYGPVDGYGRRMECRNTIRVTISGLRHKGFTITAHETLGDGRKGKYGAGYLLVSGPAAGESTHG